MTAIGKSGGAAIQPPVLSMWKERAAGGVKKDSQGGVSNLPLDNSSERPRRGCGPFLDLSRGAWRRVRRVGGGADLQECLGFPSGKLWGACVSSVPQKTAAAGCTFGLLGRCRFAEVPWLPLGEAGCGAKRSRLMRVGEQLRFAETAKLSVSAPRPSSVACGDSFPQGKLWGACVSPLRRGFGSVRLLLHFSLFTFTSNRPAPTLRLRNRRLTSPPLPFIIFL